MPDQNNQGREASGILPFAPATGATAYEKAFLAGALAQGITHNYGLSDAVFLMPIHKEIWIGCLSLLNDGVVPTPGDLITWATARQRLAAVGGHRYIHEILGDSAVYSVSLDYASKKVIEAHQARLLKEAHMEAIREIDAAMAASSYSFAEIATFSESKIFDATRSLSSGSTVSLPEAILPYREEFERKVALRGRPVGIPTGFGKLDSVLNGGLGFIPGNLVGLMGDPGQGKTAWVASLVEYLALRKVETFVVSMEMRKSSLISRLIASRRQNTVPVATVKLGLPSTADQIRGSLAEMSNDDSIHLNDSSLSIEAIESECRRLIANRGRLDVLFIDHIHIIEEASGSSSGSDSQRITRRLKRLAEELNIVIVGLLHLSAGVSQRQNKRPSLDDMKYRLGGDFDIVMGLYRDEYYNKDSTDLGVAEILLLKNREGKTVTCKVRYESEFTRFVEFTDTGYSRTIILPWEVDEVLAQLAAEVTEADSATALAPAVEQENSEPIPESSYGEPEAEEFESPGEVIELFDNEEDLGINDFLSGLSEDEADEEADELLL